MIKLSNGVFFEFMTGAGAFGFDGQGWKLTDFSKKYLPSSLKYLFFHPKLWFLKPALILLDRHLEGLVRVTKTITFRKKEGNPKAIYDGEDFVVNEVGLWNPGIKEWEKKYLPKIPSRLKIILSITENDFTTLKILMWEVARIVRENQNIVGIEFNPSCPNVAHFRKTWSERNVVRACRMIKDFCNVPLGLKIGYHQAFLRITQRTQDYVEWLSFNAIPWDIVFPEKSSPLVEKFGLKGKGGVSGKAIFEKNKEMADKIKEVGVWRPVVASSVGWAKTFKEGYQEMLDALDWADAVSFSSLFRKHPLWPIRMILRYQNEKERKRIPAVRAFWHKR